MIIEIFSQLSGEGADQLKRTPPRGTQRMPALGVFRSLTLQC